MLKALTVYLEYFVGSVIIDFLWFNFAVLQHKYPFQQKGGAGKFIRFVQFNLGHIRFKIEKNCNNVTPLIIILA